MRFKSLPKPVRNMIYRFWLHGSPKTKRSIERLFPEFRKLHKTARSHIKRSHHKSRRSKKGKRRTHRRSKKSGGKHKLRAGIHHVKIHGKMRKVKVLSTGQWRFMKGK